MRRRTTTNGWRPDDGNLLGLHRQHGSATTKAEGHASAEPAAGRALYAVACAACHGSDGRGTAQSTVGFDTPVPDFTDCSFATPEPDADWMAVMHDGGPARGFDRRMPAFGDALTEAATPTDPRLHAHVLHGCRLAARGTEPAARARHREGVSENEAVLTTTIDTNGTGTSATIFSTSSGLAPAASSRSSFRCCCRMAPDGGWQRGLGDVAVAFKHALFHSLDRGNIFSVAGEVVLPTGKESVGLGGGVTIFEPSVAYGQMLPADGFLQLQAGMELPVDRARAGQEAFWRTALGKTYSEGRFGRSWSPIVELLAARDLGQARRSTGIWCRRCRSRSTVGSTS